MEQKWCKNLSNLFYNLGQGVVEIATESNGLSCEDKMASFLRNSNLIQTDVNSLFQIHSYSNIVNMMNVFLKRLAET